MSIGRRAMLAGTAAAALAGTIRSRRARAQAASGPFKIPFIAPLSGPIGIVGAPSLIGAQFTIEEINKAGGIMGRPLELVVRDDQGKPELATAAAHELIADGSHLLIGGLNSAAGLAISPLMPQTNSVQVLVAGSGMAFSHEAFSRNTFRNSDNDYQRVNGLSRLAIEKYPDVLNWGLIVSDAASFNTSAELFRSLMTARQKARGKEPKFTEIIRAKIGASDFRPYITQLAAEPIEGIYQIVGGSDCITLWQQARSFGIAAKLKCVMDQSIDFGVAAALKKNLPPNLWGVTMWYQGLHKDIPEGARLVKYYQEKTGSGMPPGYVHYGSFAVHTVAAALKAAQGSTDAETIIKILEGPLKIPSLKGDQYYRKEDHQLIGPVDYVNTVPSDQDPGFAVGDMISFPGEDLVEPPTPGVAFKA